MSNEDLSQEESSKDESDVEPFVHMVSELLGQVSKLYTENKQLRSNLLHTNDTSQQEVNDSKQDRDTKEGKQSNKSDRHLEEKLKAVLNRKPSTSKQSDERNEQRDTTRKQSSKTYVKKSQDSRKLPNEETTTTEIPAKETPIQKEEAKASSRDQEKKVDASRSDDTRWATAYSQNLPRAPARSPPARRSSYPRSTSRQEQEVTDERSTIREERSMTRVERPTGIDESLTTRIQRSITRDERPIARDQRPAGQNGRWTSRGPRPIDQRSFRQEPAALERRRSSLKRDDFQRGPPSSGGPDVLEEDYEYYERSDHPSALETHEHYTRTERSSRESSPKRVLFDSDINTQTLRMNGAATPTYTRSFSMKDERSLPVNRDPYMPATGIRASSSVTFGGIGGNAMIEGRLSAVRTSGVNVGYSTDVGPGRAIVSGIDPCIGANIASGIGTGIGPSIAPGIDPCIGTNVASGIGTGISTSIASGIGTGIGTSIASVVGTGIGTSTVSGMVTRTGPRLVSSSTYLGNDVNTFSLRIPSSSQDDWATTSSVYRANALSQNAELECAQQKAASETIMQSYRCIGEIAFQLERRIIDYVFPKRDSEAFGSSPCRRFYGYTVSNIPSMIAKEAENCQGVFNPHRDSEIRNRLACIMIKLGKLGYCMERHGLVAQKLINKYGVLCRNSGKAYVNNCLMNDGEALRMLVKKLIFDDKERKDVLILLDCLLQLAQEDCRPLFLW